MPATSEQLCDAIYRLGTEDGTADKILPSVIAKLIGWQIATIHSSGIPQLTPYGQKCFFVMESGEGVVPELNDMAAMEDLQRPGNGQRVA